MHAEWPRIIAPLVRLLGDVQRAEDCAQDAALAALEHWRVHGIPHEPRAWLIRTARNRAVDLIRREARRQELEHAATTMDAQSRDEQVPEAEPGAGADDLLGGAHADRTQTAGGLDDDVLRLVLLCCHPAIAPASQSALCLRLLCGLTTEEIARAFLVSEETMTRRLSRAKLKIRTAHIPFRLPPTAELEGRLAGAAGTLYLMFNEGYAATGGAQAMRRPLIDESLRLARLLHQLLPQSATTCGSSR